MATTVQLRYGIIFGIGDASGYEEWEIELDGEAEKAYLEAVEKGIPFED